MVKMDEFVLYLLGDKNDIVWIWKFMLKSPVPGGGGGCGGVWGGA